MMQSILSIAILLLAAVVSAVSTTGNRLLVVLDNVAEKDSYKQFFGDLTGKKGKQKKELCRLPGSHGKAPTRSSNAANRIYR